MTTQPKILVVDDEPRAVELLVRTLRKEATMETAQSANEAWDLCQEQSFDLVISDQRMPGMTGVDLLSRLTELDATIGRILLTGYSDLEATVEAINRGRVHAYLHKPCSPQDLRVVVRSVLDRVRLERENDRLVRVVTEQNDRLRDALTSLQQAQDHIVMSERLAAIGKTAAMIVHDLRSPIALIRSSGGELVDAGLEGELGERTTEIVAEADRLSRMCEELLEVARASETTKEVIEEDLDDLIEAVLAHVPQTAGHQGVEVEFALDCGLSLPVSEDALGRALRNLVDNALQAMPDGGRLRIGTARDDEGALIRISDTGPGVPEGIRDRLFDPFVTSEKPGGSGLGLAIVRKIVEDHSGSIELEKPDADASGATFSIRLPLRTPDA